MASERSRAVVKAREFLLQLSRNSDLPEKLRYDAKFLLRHFPTRDDVVLAGRIEEQSETLPLGAMGPVFSSTFTE
ncbi:BPSL0761 family protein [Pseudomonas tohonis]|nr:BPSL0761 family protein [Pseudomonas tohonis]